MLERTPKHKELQIGFKMLCEKLLTRESFLIMEAGWKQKHGRTAVSTADLTIKRPSEADLTVVEAKFYRSRKVDLALFRNALEELKKHRDAKKAKNAIMIVTCEITPAMRVETERHGGVLWGLADLLLLTAKTPTLADTLADLLREADPGAAGRDLFSEELQQLEEQSPRIKTKSEGARLIADLDQVKPGREGVKKFEQLCDKAIRYLFADQFQRWNSQPHIDDRLHRPNLIARLVPKHEFWISLSEDFRCRYVLFSFGNEMEPLNQGEILSNLRHLSTGALRTVLLVICRGGLDAGARRASQSALRENGHVVLMLTLAELRDMLTAKDNGDEFSDVLIDRAAELLTDLTP